MANQPLQIIKTVSALPVPLAPNVIYLVRVGQGCDLYATDTTGSSAYKINVSPSQLTGAISIANSGTSDISVLLPRKIGASQRWYQSGLRHGTDYPYPYVWNNTDALNGWQYFVPFTALEDATITALEIQCTNGVANSTVGLGIYASDSNNDVAAPLFTSTPLSCVEVGPKNAPCNVQIEKGKVYWLSSLSIHPTSNTTLLVFHRNGPDSLMPIKGNTTSDQLSTIGYYTTGNTRMAQSAPTNKVDLVTTVPRVLFITG